MKHPPYSPKLVQAGSFLFPHMKEALDGQMAAIYSLITAWVGVTTTISTKKSVRRRFMAVVWALQKVYKAEGELQYVEKSYEIK